ncbi:hypothetical protein BGX26_009375 [Mortierella sp. AD094]|nr:hypothetical protein BGX26_009375 [Mortierella sp. AD094]
MSKDSTLHLQAVPNMPEIISLFGQYLTPPDLFVCVQVCRLWHDILIPQLWHTIDDSLYSWPRIIKMRDAEESVGDKDEDWIRSIFAKYGHHIRHLDIRWPFTIEAASREGACRNLESLTIHTLEFYGSMKEEEEHKEAVRKHSIALHNHRALGLPLNEFMGTELWVGAPEVAGPLLSPAFEGIFEPNAQSKLKLQWERAWMTIQYYWLLVRQNQSLHTIEYDSDHDTAYRVTSKEFLYSTWCSLPKLTHLHFNDRSLELNTTLDRLPNLHSLGSDVSFTNIALEKTFTNLRILSMRGPESILIRSVLIFLKHLPNVESLCVYEVCDEQFALNAGTILDYKSSDLKVLHVNGNESNTHELISNYILPWVPQLIEISIGMIFPATAQALAAHCKRIRDVIGSSFRNFASPDLHESLASVLFRSCEHLQVFSNIYHRNQVDQLSLEQPWVCHDLRVLRCQFVGFDRLTNAQEDTFNKVTAAGYSEPLSDEEQEVIERHRRCREQQMLVYNQLADLTQPKILDLGEEIHELRQVDLTLDPMIVQVHETYQDLVQGTMELSLESGIDRLASLKNLEVFGFEGVDQKIGKPELEWMATNWPKLRIMRGLQ